MWVALAKSLWYPATGTHKSAAVHTTLAPCRRTALSTAGRFVATLGHPVLCIAAAALTLPLHQVGRLPSTSPGIKQAGSRKLLVCTDLALQPLVGLQREYLQAMPVLSVHPPVEEGSSCGP